MQTIVCLFCLVELQFKHKFFELLAFGLTSYVVHCCVNVDMMSRSVEGNSTR